MIWESIILGVIQGLTEFLPVSSTAHLVVIPIIFHWNSPLLNSLTFDVALHVGTLIAVVGYFFRETIDLITGFIGGLLKMDFSKDEKTRLSWLVFWGTIPAGILGVFLDNWVESKFRTPAVLATMMVVIGILMWYSEKRASQNRDIKKMSLRDAITVGFAQALALVPGTSRSGVTISAGLLLNYNREDAARFSFLLSIPVIAGAAVLKLKQFFHGVPHNEIAPLIFGTIFSALFGFLSIKYFMRYLQQNTLKAFVWYRVGFAILIILFIYIF